MTTYIWRSGLPKRRVHIRMPSGSGTYCKLENGNSYKKLDSVSEEYPGDLIPCSICQFKFSQKKKTKKSRKRRDLSDKKKQWRKDRELARESLLKHFGLHKYATNMAICFCIHKECETPVAENDNQAREMIVDYWKNMEGEATRKKYNFMPASEFYSSKKWREVRYIALQQSEGCCNLCGARASDGVQLHVDHIIPRSKSQKLQFDLSNLQVMCDDCNMGKSNYDDTNWKQHWDSI